MIKRYKRLNITPYKKKYPIKEEEIMDLGFYDEPAEHEDELEDEAIEQKPKKKDKNPEEEENDSTRNSKEEG